MACSGRSRFLSACNGGRSGFVAVLKSSGCYCGEEIAGYQTPYIGGFTGLLGGIDSRR